MGKRGKVIIPSFSVGRTQQIVYVSMNCTGAGKLPHIPMYVDSPLSSKASGVYEKNRPSLRPDLPADFSFFVENLTYIADAEESKKRNDRHEPMIIISASGMAEAGRIRHHLKNNIGDPKNLILFIGYCAEGTLGSQITAGKSPVNIFGEPHDVRAKVASLDTYSGHADRSELKQYVQQFDRQAAPDLLHSR